MKNQSRAVKNGSKAALPPQSANVRSRAGDRPASPVKFRVKFEDQERVIDVKLDCEQVQTIEDVSARCGLTLEELFHFIFFRQMESFHPIGGEFCYRVWGAASEEVASGLEKANDVAATIKAISQCMMDAAKDSEEQDRLNGRAFSPRWAAWCFLLNKIATGLAVTAADAKAHWGEAIVPALCERIPPSVTAAQRRAA